VYTVATQSKRDMQSDDCTLNTVKVLQSTHQVALCRVRWHHQAAVLGSQDASDLLDAACPRCLPGSLWDLQVRLGSVVFGICTNCTLFEDHVP